MCFEWTTHGWHLLDQINQVLQRYGYPVAETTHDCGELGGLAQSRKRFLLWHATPRRCRRPPAKARSPLRTRAPA
ncbi:hypothetical protein [Massilia sp. IC2-476]|uniref:hypothetical protein n=1 Tax=Massilia sp. IC2-476 TaxID=2887199 RepID=UPI001D1262CD|nr:hypothetical protein [Massilia sp. IC2-476]MCC2971792.1 hypothetical protein [Massilia sp. IC2-476]